MADVMELSMDYKIILARLQKWWWLILSSTILAASVSFFAVSQQPEVYKSNATLLIGNALNNPNPTGNEFWLSQQLAQVYTDLAQRDVVQEAVKQSLGLSSLPNYTVRSVPNSQLIEISVTDSLPERAMAVANELANQLMLQSPTNSSDAEEVKRQEFIRKQLDDLERNIQETSESILALQEELAVVTSARQISDTQNQIAALNSKLSSLQSNYASLLSNTNSVATNTLNIVESATLPQAPIGPETLMTVLTAGAIGLSLAVAAVLLFEYLDDTLRNPTDIYHTSKLPTLSGIADFKTNNGGATELITLSHPRSQISEAYRSLRTAILFSNVDDKIRTLLITSSNPDEGKSITAANLGIVMAQAGQRVLLIDADLRRPKQHQYFSLPSNSGLTNLLVQIPNVLEPSNIDALHVNVNKAVFKSKQPGLFILPSGSIPPNPAEIVGSAKMKKLLKILGTRFDYIIIDSPPTLAVTDAVILSTRVDSVLMITNAGRTRRNQLKQAINRLQEVNANLAGVVLNRLTNDSGDYYYYGYQNNGYYQNLGEPDGDSGSLDVSRAWEKQPENKDRQVSRKLVPSFLTRLLS
jgi:polysaccharide biosynthesis transport protein